MGCGASAKAPLGSSGIFAASSRHVESIVLLQNKKIVEEQFAIHNRME